jgi:excisionase family DNA binding protein
MNDILSTNDASKLLNLTPEAVRLLERKGKLPAVRTPGGIRIFSRLDVEKLVAERAQRKRFQKSEGGR